MDWMPEDHAVRSDGKFEVSDRRFPHRPSVDQHLAPGLCVETQVSHRQAHRDERRMAWLDDYRLTRTKLQRLIHELEFMLAGGELEPIAVARADEPAVFVDLDLNRKIDRYPSRRRRQRNGRDLVT